MPRTGRAAPGRRGRGRSWIKRLLITTGALAALVLIAFAIWSLMLGNQLGSVQAQLQTGPAGQLQPGKLDREVCSMSRKQKIYLITAVIFLVYAGIVVGLGFLSASAGAAWPFFSACFC